MPARAILTPAQLSAWEVYVSDPIHLEADDLDDEYGPTAAEYRTAAGCLRGRRLVVPRDQFEQVDRVLTEACNSADSEGTKAGNGAARALVNLADKLRRSE